jgi:hypothetical protein
VGLKKFQNPWLCDTLWETEKIISQITCPPFVLSVLKKKEEQANPGLKILESLARLHLFGNYEGESAC